MKRKVFSVEFIPVFNGFDKSYGMSLLDKKEYERLPENFASDAVYEVEYEDRKLIGSDILETKIVKSKVDLLKLFINTFGITREEYNMIYAEELEEKLRNK